MNFKPNCKLSYDKKNIQDIVYWVSKASPTLGMIYVCMSTKNTYVKMCGQNYVAQTCACSKSVLGSQNRPVTPVLFISTRGKKRLSETEEDHEKQKRELVRYEVRMRA